MKHIISGLLLTLLSTVCWVREREQEHNRLRYSFIEEVQLGAYRRLRQGGRKSGKVKTSVVVGDFTGIKCTERER